MFVVETAIVLVHPPHVVARAVARLDRLPRWCAGLQRLRDTGPGDAAAGAGGVEGGCAFRYVAADLRLTLRAHTVAAASSRPPGHVVEHRAAGDGLHLAWALDVEPEPGGGRRTRLHVRTRLAVDPAHPVAAVRAALCRLVARRAPSDLERLRTLLDRRAAAVRARTSAPLPMS